MEQVLKLLNEELKVAMTLSGSLASHTHFRILRFAQGKGSGQRSIPSLFPGS